MESVREMRFFSVDISCEMVFMFEFLTSKRRLCKVYINVLTIFYLWIKKSRKRKESQDALLQIHMPTFSLMFSAQFYLLINVPFLPCPTHFCHYLLESAISFHTVLAHFIQSSSQRSLECHKTGEGTDPWMPVYRWQPLTSSSSCSAAGC